MDRSLLFKELVFKTARSSGPGGQHVNKTNTKVILIWSLLESTALNEDEKLRLNTGSFAKRINQQGVFQLSSGQTRSQLKNKELVTSRFFSIINAALRIQKKRKPTTRTKASSLKRLKHKRITSDKKILRKRPDV